MIIKTGANGAFYVWDFQGIENGSPDGIALIGECGDVIEFISYAGDFIATDGKAKGIKSVDIGINELPSSPENSSLQLIDGVWIFTVGFNTKGLVNDKGPCMLITPGLKDTLCNNNNTSFDPADDYITFTCNPLGNQLKGKYRLTSSKTKIIPETANFNVQTSFRTESGTAGKGNIIVEMKSLDSANCSMVFTIFDTGTCSPDCALTNSNISAVRCNENSTNTDTLDDFLWFYLKPAGFNLGAKYKVQVSKGTITPASANYGVETYFSLQPGSAGAGDVELTITDIDKASCSIKHIIKDGGPCSPNAVYDQEIKEKQVVLYPNPAGDILNLHTENDKIVFFNISDLVGRKLINGVMDHRIDISALSSSVYVIMFYDRNYSTVEIQKFVKE
jgi:hypothetical protein